MQHEAEVPSAETLVEYRMVRGPKPRAEMIESESYEVVTNVVKTRDKDTTHVCDVRLK